MSKNNDKDLEALLASGKEGNHGGDALERLADRIERRYDKEDQDEAQRAQEQAEYRRQQLDAVARAMASRNAAQEGCTHMKPNYTPATNGQRDHSGEIHLVCSYCGKEFGAKELSSPRYMQLMLPAERIGGPIY